MRSDDSSSNLAAVAHRETGCGGKRPNWFVDEKGPDISFELRHIDGPGMASLPVSGLLGAHDELRLAASPKTESIFEKPPFARLTFLAGALLLAAVVVAAVGFPIFAAVMVAGAAAAGLWAYRRQRLIARAVESATGAEKALGSPRWVVESVQTRRDEAVAKVRAVGLVPDAKVLRDLAAMRGAHERSKEKQADWDARSTAARARVDSTGQALRDALTDRGISGGEDIDAAFRAYIVACQDRSAQHTEAAKADAVRRAIQAREEAEQAARAETKRVTDAESALRTVAIKADLGADEDADRLVAELEQSQRARALTAAAGDQALREWQELRSLLGDGTFADLEKVAVARARRASELAAGFDDDRVTAVAVESDRETHRSILQVELEGLATRADQLERDVENTRSRLRDVAEAQENADRCDAESARLDRLAVTIDRTIELLEEAQTRVHRDLAPILVGAIRPRLAAVTGGRYVDVSVDAATLEVRVKESPALGGHWRKADDLSRGTREQAYLLLRAAMAKHLVTTNEIAPLILDEVTAQSDEVRTVAILTTLHELSVDRQVVLFSHDPTVASWARANLSEPLDLLVELQPTGSCAGGKPCAGSCHAVPV